MTSPYRLHTEVAPQGSWTILPTTQKSAEAHASGLKVREGVRFFIRYGSGQVEDCAIQKGWRDLFRKWGFRSFNLDVEPASERGQVSSPDQVTVSAINRNFQGRSGPGQLYLQAR